MVTNLSGLKDEEITSNIMNTQLFKRRISVEDVSNAVVFLASEEARNIQGSVIYIDAGHLAV